MADLIVTETAGVHRPRNLDWKRAAALLYGDWGTSKAYVIGLAFLAAGFSSFPIILAVLVLRVLWESTTLSPAAIFRWRGLPRRARKDDCLPLSVRCCSSRILP